MLAYHTLYNYIIHIVGTMVLANSVAMTAQVLY